jgi:protein-S-isoprenylcysteine O-methyltransferase Ste14
MPSSAYAGLLFAGYALIATGIDPDVFAQQPSDGLQSYISSLSRILQVYVAVLLLAHSFAPATTWGLERLPLLNGSWVNEIGLLLGVAGLALCWYAQRTMAASWRVGIDEMNATKLITEGPFGFVRNPTYSGLFLLTLGFWLIWPTWAVLTFDLIFVIMLEVQVRCEEEYLFRHHGKSYAAYFAKTKRYIPGIY